MKTKKRDGSHLQDQGRVTCLWEQRTEIGRGDWEILRTIPPPVTSGLLFATNAVRPVRQDFFRLRVGP